MSRFWEVDTFATNLWPCTNGRALQQQNAAIYCQLRVTEFSLLEDHRTDRIENTNGLVVTIPISVPFLSSASFPFESMTPATPAPAPMSAPIPAPLPPPIAPPITAPPAVPPPT